MKTRLYTRLLPAAAYQGNIPVYLDNKNCAGDQLFILINPALSCEKINGIVEKFKIEVIK
jgi:hypothetical protein